MDSDDAFAVDLRDAIASLARRGNVCHLVALDDLENVLPARRLSRTEARKVVAALADAGLHVVEPDILERLVERP